MKAKGGEAIVKALEDSYVEFAFGIPGVHTLQIYNALYDSRIRHILTRHEQAAAFMADGYGRATGKVAAVLLAGSVGTLNAAGALSEAFLDSTPLIAISAGVRSSWVGKGALHEVDQLHLVSGITKWRGQARSVSDIYSLVTRGISIATSGRPGPVFIEAPAELLGAEDEIERSHIFSRATYKPDHSILSQTSSMLLKANRPIIIAGGGTITSDASSELMELAGLLGVPVTTTIMGKGAFPENSPLSLGLLYERAAINACQRSDVVLALGCRFSERSTSFWKLRLPRTLIHVDVDPKELGKNYPVELGIAVEIKEFMRELLAELGTTKIDRHPRDPWLDEVKLLKAQAELEQATKMEDDSLPVKPQRVMKELSNVLKDGSIVTGDSGNNFWWVASLLKARRPRSYILPAGNAIMGFGFPAALGAKCGKSDSEVFSVCGDAGFMMSCQELATAVQEKLPLIAIILNDGGAGAMRHRQREKFMERYIAVDMHFPDIPSFAKSFGAIGFEIAHPQDIGPCLEDALKQDRPVLVDIKIDRDEVALPPSFL